MQSTRDFLTWYSSHTTGRVAFFLAYMIALTKYMPIAPDVLCVEVVYDLMKVSAEGKMIVVE